MSFHSTLTAVRNPLFAGMLFALLPLLSLAGSRAVGGDRYEVDVHRNLEYRRLASGELLPIANRLDVYVPRGKQDFPVLVLVHGGAWVAGDKTLDFLPLVARRFAEQGLGVVAPNYRLSPFVRHPSHVQDVAQAVAWTVKNMGQYGARTDGLLLVGHSAGGHLVSLLATDPQYLQAAGVASELICGVVSVSGVYQLSDLTANGVTPGLALSPKAAVVTSPFAMAFGVDPVVWKAASPHTHVREGLPPFLLITARCDLPTLSAMAEEFHRELDSHGVEAQRVEANCRSHATNFWRMALEDDATFGSTLQFLKEHAPGTGRR